MNDRNNLGRQYASDPHSGKTHPDAQYGGSQDHERAPYGTPAGEHWTPSANQYGYTNQYQGQNPGHQENPLPNVRAHGSSQYGQPTGKGSLSVGAREQDLAHYSHRTPQYQGPAGQTHAETGWGAGSGYGSPLTQGMGGMGSGSQWMGGTGYSSSLAQGRGGAGYGSSFAQGGMEGTGYGSPLTQWMGGSSQLEMGSSAQAGNPAGMYQSMIETSGMGPSLPGGTSYSGGTAANPTAASEMLVRGQDQPETQFNDRDRLQDLLSTEKYLTEGYNISTFEATNPELYATLRTILQDTHQNRDALYHTMEQRGWYRTEPADQQTVEQAHSQFTQSRHQLPF